MRLIIMGPPGAGKGTQAKQIIKELDIPHISTGDIFRKNIEQMTDLGRKVKKYLDRGELVPDELTIDMVMNRLDEDDAKEGFLLDGFPRTINQAEALEKGLDERGVSLDRVLNIDVDPKVLTERLSGRRVCTNCGASYHVVTNPPKEEGICDECKAPLIQREDDNEETVLDRIHVYESQTAPLIDYYKDRDLLFTVDGSLPITEISEVLIKELKK